MYSEAFNSPDPVAERRCDIAARVCGWGALALACTALAGWVFDVPRLRTVRPDWVEMKVNTACCLGATAIALLLRVGRWRERRLAHWAANGIVGASMLIGFLTAVEYAFGIKLGIDELFFHEGPDLVRPFVPGRMAPAAAGNYVMLGIALLLLDHRMAGRRSRISPLLALAAGGITILAAIRYFYGVETFAGTLPYVTIAAHTVTGLGLLSLGILCARSDNLVMNYFWSQNLSGIFIRRMLPAAIAVPLVLGWISVSGQRAGNLGLGFGTAVFATLMIGTFVGLSLWVARLLARGESERLEQFAALQETAARLEASESKEAARRREAETLLRRVESVREEERGRLAREIHDVLAQELTRLKLDIAWMKLRLEKDGTQDRPSLEKKLASMSGMVDGTLSAVKRMATELRPIVLDTLGLPAAVEWQAKEFESRTGIKCRTSVTENGLALSREKASALFRILQESLTNVARHAKARNVEVALRSEEKQVVMAVEDDGVGISPEALSDGKSLGLLGMRERALLLGGECRIGRAERQGTAVQVIFPAKGKESEVSW